MNSCSISIVQFVEDDKVVGIGKASLLLPADIVVSYLRKASAKPFGSLPQDVYIELCNTPGRSRDPIVHVDRPVPVKHSHS